MNNYIAQGEGFPADNEFLMFIQEMIQQASQLARIGGDTYILYGCIEAAGNVSDGWMVLGGEIIPFEGGALGAQVTIIEEVEQATYLEDNDEDGLGDDKDAYFTRYARFGNDGAATYNWSDLRRVNPLIEAQQALVPVGGIIVWSGAVAGIPEGWALCNGSNGTPDLSGRFIVGYFAGDSDYGVIGNTGGQASVTLTQSQIPQHNHTGTVTIPPHSHNLPGPVPSAGGAGTNQLSNANNVGHTAISQTSSSNSINAGFTTANAGGGGSHENRPPYFTLAYIMYIGIGA